MKKLIKAGAWIASAIFACLAPTGVSAAPLACVQRAINWNNARAGNYVTFSMVALHETGAGAFASGTLRNSVCNRNPYAAGTVGCLVGARPFKAQLLRPFTTTNPSDLLSMTINGIPSDTLAQVHFGQPNATYDFDPACVGNLLVGNDQWGNHWTVSFQFYNEVVIH